MTGPPGGPTSEPPLTPPIGPVSCASCGTVATDGPPLDWTMQVERGRVQHVCVACARADLRAIEAKLAPEWW